MNRKRAQEKAITKIATHSWETILAAKKLSGLKQNSKEIILENREVLRELWGEKAVDDHDSQINRIENVADYREILK